MTPVWTRHLRISCAVALPVALAALVPAAHAETPRKAVDVTVDGLVCTVSYGQTLSSSRLVPGTSSARIRLTAPTVVANGEPVTIRDLRVDLFTNATAELAAQGFTYFQNTPYAFAAWSQAPGFAENTVGHTFDDVPLGATSVLSTPTDGTSGRRSSGWDAPAPATGTAPAVASFFKFGAYGYLTPTLSGDNLTSGTVDCVPPEGVQPPIVSVPVRDDLPAVTSISPARISVLAPTVVTIRGKNFKNVRAIDLGKGGRTKAFTVVSSTQIQVLVLPLDSGNFRLSVVTPAYSTPTTLLFVKPWF